MDERRKYREKLLEIFGRAKKQWESLSEIERLFRSLLNQILESTRVTALKNSFYHNPEDYASKYVYGVLLYTDEIVLKTQSEIMEGSDFFFHPRFPDGEWCQSKREIRINKILLSIKELHGQIQNNENIYIKLKRIEEENDIDSFINLYTQANEEINLLYRLYKEVNGTDSDMFENAINIIESVIDFMYHFHYDEFILQYKKSDDKPLIVIHEK